MVRKIGIGHEDFAVVRESNNFKQTLSGSGGNPMTR